MGTQSLLGDLEVETKIRILEDSSAAKGIAERTGLGKVRHIEVNQLWIQEKVREGRIQLVKVEGTENLADALTKYVDSDMLDKHIKGSECEVAGGRHELMPEVQSGEIDPKEGQESEIADQEEDQLGHLGCLSHEESNHKIEGTVIDDSKMSVECKALVAPNRMKDRLIGTDLSRQAENYQHNNEYKGHNHNEQMSEKEREYSSEESNSGLIDPREIKQIEVYKVNSSSVHNTISLSNVSTICPMEAQSIQIQCNNSSVSSENNNHNNHHYNSSERDPNERVNFDSLENSCPDSIGGGGSETPKQCLGAHDLKKTLALVGHKTPLLRRSFDKEALALVGHRHLRSARFWIEEYAPVHKGIGCAHSIRRGARDTLCTSPYGWVRIDHLFIVPIDLTLAQVAQQNCVA
jgi:hypothetical protein